MKIRPLRNRILIQRDPPADRIGRIIVPQTAKEPGDELGLPPRESTILAIGPDVHPQLGLEVGQRVIVGKMRGQAVKSRSFSNEGDRMQLVDTDDVFAIIDPAK